MNRVEKKKRKDKQCADLGDSGVCMRTVVFARGDKYKDIKCPKESGK